MEQLQQCEIYEYVLIGMPIAMLLFAVSIMMFGLWWEKVPAKCKHTNKKEVSRDYPDAYVKYKCEDCGEYVYEDMYND